MKLIKSKVILSVIVVCVNFLSFYAQEAGDFNWKEWKAVIPLSNEYGKSTIIGGKEIRKAKFSDQEDDYIKKNSNDTYSLTASFTGITEEGGAEILNRKYSNTELIEVYEDKLGNNYWRTNLGSHTLKTRMKVQESIGNVNVTYLFRITSKNKKDLVRLVWKDGNLFALFFKPDKSGRSYSKVKIGKIGTKMFDLNVTVKNGLFSIGIECDKAGIKRPNIVLGRIKEINKALFRLGNYFKNNDNYDDKVIVQIKHADIVHKNK